MASLFSRKNRMIKKMLRLQKKENILYLELNAPPANQTDRLFYDELAEVIPALQNDDAWGLIIYGCGRHFSAGADIGELKELAVRRNNLSATSLMTRSVALFNNLTELPYPVIAAIQGCCMGSGLELALACHHRLSAKNGFFSLPETTFKLMPGCGGTICLPKLVGLGKTIELILSGGSCLAEDALNFGLIDCIVDKKQLLPAAVRMINLATPFSGPLLSSRSRK